MGEKTEHRLQLEARAAGMGLKFPKNIGDDKLAERIEDAGASGNPVPALRVVGPKGGFRRAGRTFGPDPIDIALADLTETQVTALTAEKKLVVAEVELDPVPLPE